MTLHPRNPPPAPQPLRRMTITAHTSLGRQWAAVITWDGAALATVEHAGGTTPTTLNPFAGNGFSCGQLPALAQACRGGQQQEPHQIVNDLFCDSLSVPVRHLTALVPGPVCPCPSQCASCGQPHAGMHCSWATGGQPYEARHRRGPALVERSHCHLPGCPHAVSRPDGLFDTIDADGTEQCIRCGSVDTSEHHSIDSYGGTTEYFSRCTACGSTWSGIDLTAIL